MELQGIKWLENKVPAFSQLNTDEKSAILDFCMLWSFFESQNLAMNANVASIRGFVSSIETTSIYTKLDFSECESHFKKRYFDGTSKTSHYDDLHIDRSGYPPEVEELLTNDKADRKTKLIACLVIIYRYRNNLFHGEKWQYNLKDQLENFTQSNNLLMGLMS